MSSATVQGGRVESIAIPQKHFVNGRPLKPPFPADIEIIYLGMGCFWGAERLFWQQPGVWTTAVGYAGGVTLNPTYEEVCAHETGHAEVVLIGYDPDKMACQDLFQLFWESHDPTQGMRQGNDIGSQYRSVIYTTKDSQQALARQTRDEYQGKLNTAGYNHISTEIQPAPQFFYAEEYHQQYLAKNPDGYCGIGGTGVCLP